MQPHHGSLRNAFTRRESLAAGALTLLGGGFTLPSLLAAEARSTAKRPGKAKNVILLYLLGGAATQDMWDLKPDAPTEIRGEFRPIDTTAPGIRICEHLPRTSKWMHKAAIVRSVNHKAGCHNCLPSYTGFEQLMPDQHPRDSDPPSMGAVCEYLRGDRGDPATRRPGDPATRRPGDPATRRPGDPATRRPASSSRATPRRAGTPRPQVPATALLGTLVTPDSPSAGGTGSLPMPRLSREQSASLGIGRIRGTGGSGEKLIPTKDPLRSGDSAGWNGLALCRF